MHSQSINRNSAAFEKACSRQMTFEGHLTSTEIKLL